jgi:hypothetical protein
MAPRVIRESHDGGHIATSIELGDMPYESATGTIRVEAWTRGSDAVVLHLTATEVGALIADLVCTLSDLDGTAGPADIMRMLAGSPTPESAATAVETAAS